MRKFGLFFGLILLLSAGGVFASGSNENASKSSAQKQVTIHIVQDSGANPYAEQATKDDIYFKYESQIFSKYVGQNVYVWDEYLNHRNYGQVVTLRFASGNLPDVIYMNSIQSSWAPQAVQHGIFLDLTNLLQKYGQNVIKGLPSDIFNSPRLSYDGKIYGLPKMAAAPATRVVYYRKDWLNQLGLQPPKTLDDYLNVFKAIKDKLHKTPIAARENVAYSEWFFGYFDAFPGTWYVDSNGQLMPENLSPRMKEAIKFWKMLYDNGYVNQDLFTLSGSKWVNEIRNGDFGFWLHDIQNLKTSWNPKGFSNPNVQLGVLPGPVNAQGQYHNMPRNDGFYAAFVVNAKTKNPDLIMKLFNWEWSNDTAKNRLFSFGIPDRNYTVQNGQVKWDPNAKVNTDLFQEGFYQVVLPSNKDYRLSPLLIGLDPNKTLLNEGLKIANEMTFNHVDLFMPPLQTLINNPDLSLNVGVPGTLWLQMFANVITGREDLDTAFANFVTTWKQRGGDKVIAEANAWYKTYKQQHSGS